MRILLTLPELNSGGVESHVFDLACALRTKGHHVAVVSAGGRKVADLENKGVVHHQIDVKSKSLYKIIKAIRTMKRIIQNENIQVVHAHSRVPAWIGYNATRKTGVPFVTTAHSKYSIHLGSKSMVKGDLIIVVSQAVADHLHQGFNTSYERMVHIPPAIDIKTFEQGNRFRTETRKELGFREEEIVIGNVARLTEVKGHQYFLQAAAIIKDKLESEGQRNIYKFLIVGDGPEREVLEELARELDIMDKVIFTGDRRDIPELLAAMDIFVLSSLSEGLGLAAVEAMAARRPVVLTESGGLAEQITDGQEALLVPVAEPHVLASKIYQLSREYELMRALAENGYNFIKNNFSISKMVEETITVYQKLVIDLHD